MLRIGRIETYLLEQAQHKEVLVAALIDPDNFGPKEAAQTAKESQKAGVSIILVGGSTISDQKHLDDVVMAIKKSITLPVILFPGNITGVSPHADAILFGSLLNSYNNYFIVGAQAIGAIQVRKYNLEAIPMGYIVLGDGSSTSFVGEAKIIPSDKPSIGVMYALAAQFMGMRSLYLEAGSGSKSTIPSQFVSEIRKYFTGLLIVGGGITTPAAARLLASSGADVLVIGNLLQTRAGLDRLSKIVKATRSA